MSKSNQLDLSLPMSKSDVFHFDENKANFNSLSQENGFTHWFASDLMKMLGYESETPFKKSIQRAISTCATLNIPIMDNFVQIAREGSGKTTQDYKLSRFACYLVAMNGDTKKPEVARAQAYFAAMAEAFRRYVEQGEEFDRLLERDEITLAEKSLSAAAKGAGVDKFGLFQNAGYRGMYNMNIKDLKRIKEVPNNRSPLDFMGSTELAANRFRITQTEAKLRNEGIKGQRSAERTAENVGRKVRETMYEISGDRPEALPRTEDIKKVRSAVKSSHKDFAKLDKK